MKTKVRQMKAGDILGVSDLTVGDRFLDGIIRLCPSCKSKALELTPPGMTPLYAHQAKINNQGFAIWFDVCCPKLKYQSRKALKKVE
jgi:hypothetical protein